MSSTLGYKENILRMCAVCKATILTTTSTARILITKTHLALVLSQRSITESTYLLANFLRDQTRRVAFLAEKIIQEIFQAAFQLRMRLSVDPHLSNDVMHVSHVHLQAGLLANIIHDASALRSNCFQGIDCFKHVFRHGLAHVWVRPVHTVVYLVVVHAVIVGHIDFPSGLRQLRTSVYLRFTSITKLSHRIVFSMSPFHITCAGQPILRGFYRGRFLVVRPWGLSACVQTNFLLKCGKLAGRVCPCRQSFCFWSRLASRSMLHISAHIVESQFRILYTLILHKSFGFQKPYQGCRIRVLGYVGMESPPRVE